MKLHLLLLWGLFSLFHVDIADAVERPLVLIPGVMGSNLCDGNKKIIWGDNSSYTLSRLAALRLPFDRSKRDPGIHSCGLIESVNIVPFFWESNVYKDLLKKIQTFGYDDKDKNNFVKFHYDWRLSNFENADRLKEVIEKHFDGRPGKVDIVAHSMGGIIARIYVQALGGESRVHNLIMLGTPHLGSASIFDRLHNGFQNWPSAWSGGLPEIQKTILSFPSTYQLLPTYQECCAFGDSARPAGNDTTYVDILVPETWARFGWLPDEFKRGAGVEFLKGELAEARRLKALLAAPILRDPAGYSRLRFIANGFLSTWSRVFFDPDNGAITGNIKNRGDGTVLLWSATNGFPSQVQISLKEHALVFAGDAADLILRVVLSDERLHSAKQAAPSQRLFDAKRKPIEVTQAALSLEPRFVAPAGAVTLTLSLRIENPPRDIDLSNLVAQLSQDDSLIESKQPQEVAAAPEGLTLRYQFSAPAQLGPYSIRLQLGDIETFETIFAVVGR
jgi:pimeloyl-ACP methyl ester carboxylesterase